MTWEEFAVARQLLAEETLGRAVRRVEAEEDAAFAAAARYLKED
jgi:hypothetical protein